MCQFICIKVSFWSPSHTTFIVVVRIFVIFINAYLTTTKKLNKEKGKIRRMHLNGREKNGSTLINPNFIRFAKRAVVRLCCHCWRHVFYICSSLFFYIYLLKFCKHFMKVKTMDHYFYRQKISLLIWPFFVNMA